MPAPELRWTATERRVLDQYIARYAEPEAKYATELSCRYAAAVVLPLCGEHPELIERFTETLVGSGASAPEPLPCLLIAVVNARRDAPPSVIQTNDELLADWRGRARRRTVFDAIETSAPEARTPAAAELLELPGESLHVLLLDASREGHRFPPRQGVGLARRIGCDLAVALARRGKLVRRYVASTDGDVHWPAGYLAALDRSPDAAALLFPFEHIDGGDARVLEATRLVELSWRYYVLGLAWAGSPFAYHSLGSCLAVEVTAYVRARGFPRRQAAEDFHLLAKLAKLGELEVLTEPTVQIVARRSGRVPFGTGPAVERVLVQGAEADTSSDGAFRLHDPRVFVGLRWLAEELGSLARGALGGHREPPQGLPIAVRELLRTEAERWKATLTPRVATCPSAAHRRHRVFEGFDALATLQTLHALRDAALPPIPWRQALGAAPFFPFSAGGSSADALALARELERALPRRRGLRSPRPLRGAGSQVEPGPGSQV